VNAIGTLAVIFVWLAVIILVGRSVWHRSRGVAVAVVACMLVGSIALPALMVNSAAGSSYASGTSTGK
jgi:hypothetical protein